jgi:alpha-galactosidase
VRHVQGLYDLKRRVSEESPEVTIECCAGGGGRVDYGILRYCETALVSDNHDPLSRLLIQEGYSQVFPAKTMGSWVTDPSWPLTGRSLPMAFTFHVAMMGTMGIMSNILSWDEQQTEYARGMIQLYKQVRPIIHEGDLYRLSSLRTSHLAAVQYVSPEGTDSVIFAFMRTHLGIPSPVPNIIQWGQPRFPFRVYPKGLIPDAIYQIGDHSDLRSGVSLMLAGLEIEMSGDGDSKLIRLSRIDRP